MNTLEQWFDFSPNQRTLIQRWLSAIILIAVAITAVYLVYDGQRLTNDVEYFLNGDNFKIIGEISNIQREILKTQVALKDIRILPGSDYGNFRQRYASAKTTFGIIEARAGNAENRSSFADESLGLIDEMTNTFERIDALSIRAEAAETITELLPILREIDRLFDTLELQANDLYISQENYRIGFLSTAVDSVVSSRIVMIIASAVLLFLSLAMVYTTQRNSVIQQEANERFKLASAAVNSAIYDWDVVRNQIVWTDGLNEVFGYVTTSQWVQIEWFWGLVHPDDLERVQYQYQKAQDEGGSFAIEHRFLTNDGVYLDVSNRVQVVTDTRNQVVRMVGSIEDITERRLMLAYQESNRAKNRLLAHVSHELNTPLSAIIGYTEIIHAGVYGSITGEQKHSLERILANARSLLELINNLLTQTRAEEKEDNINLGLLSPDDLVTILEEAVGVLADSKGLVLTHEIDQGVPQALIGDIGQLRQIITNLAGNSVKFTESGSIHMQISRPESKFWSFSITDTGIGISEANQEMIFESFTQVNQLLEADSKGFGLGLSIVTQILQNLNGRIELQSELGKGSTFTVTLPLIKRMEM